MENTLLRPWRTPQITVLLVAILLFQALDAWSTAYLLGWHGSGLRLYEANPVWADQLNRLYNIAPLITIKLAIGLVVFPAFAVFALWRWPRRTGLLTIALAVYTCLSAVGIAINAPLVVHTLG